MRVIVVDDNAVWRASLVTALESRGISVVAESADGSALLEHFDKTDYKPVDVAILDLRLPPTWSDEGIHLANALRTRIDGVGIVILSGYEHDVQLHYATRAFDSLGDGGGIGYLFKDHTSRSGLRDSVHRVASGRVVVDPIPAEPAVAEYRSRLVEAAGVDREAEVLTLLLRGMVESEIANALSADLSAIERELTTITRRLLGATAAQSNGLRLDGMRAVAILELLRQSGRLS